MWENDLWYTHTHTHCHNFHHLVSYPCTYLTRLSEQLWGISKGSFMSSGSVSLLLYRESKGTHNNLTGFLIGLWKILTSRGSFVGLVVAWSFFSTANLRNHPSEPDCLLYLALILNDSVFYILLILLFLRCILSTVFYVSFYIRSSFPIASRFYLLCFFYWWSVLCQWWYSLSLLLYREITETLITT